MTAVLRLALAAVCAVAVALVGVADRRRLLGPYGARMQLASVVAAALFLLAALDAA